MTYDYRPVLDLAISAAQAAGELLRQEFHRPGGPAGAYDKAPADTLAERVIRNILLSATPSWSYLGEETGGQTGSSEEGFCWLVDPNDGTRYFLKGYRGPAVSIGLIRDGVPVLGVVYSYVHPDDSGDFFSWAEGCGPLMRNGFPVQRPPWSPVLSPTEITLVSQAGDAKPAVNVELASPGRFRAMPSIAYRLALAAVGEGEVAVALSHPSGYDYAGGHALLRAVGGVLIDQDGRGITYTRHGDSSTSYCFGGNPDVARVLTRRRWGDIFARPVEPSHTYDLASMQPGINVTDAGLLSRAQGCFLAQLSGDALGSLVEFQTPQQIASSHPQGVRRLVDGGTFDTIAGQPTDDSEMALMLARSLLRAGRYDAEEAAAAYSYWIRSGPFDLGTTTRQALGSITAEDVAQKKAAERSRRSANPESQANGSLMRISPLGIWGHRLDPLELYRMAQSDSSLTHPHPVCQEAVGIFTVAIASAIRSGRTPADVYQETLEFARQNVRQNAVLQALQQAATRPPQDFHHHMGWVLTAFQNAFYRLLSASGLEQGIVQTVMCGGDTDTNAAIAGALLGAVYGRPAVPFQWRQMVLTCRPHRSLPHVRKPRPRGFWPVDAMELSERLLCLGSTDLRT